MKTGGNHSRRIKHKRWLERRARRKYFGAVGSARWIRRSPWSNIDAYTSANVLKVQADALEITLPPRLDFDENYEETASHFQLVRDASHGRFRLRKLRFDNLEFISPAAALVLASEVDRWNQLVGGRLKAQVDSWKDEIKRLLCEMGYFELLGLRRPQLRGQENKVTFLNFLRGESGEGDSDGGKLAKQLRINIEAIVGQGINRHFLFEGLSEAITNVSQHAYPHRLTSNRKKQWWLSASFDRHCRNLSVMFYDQGVGIPATLPRSRFFEHMKAVFASWTDGEKIKAAMEYGRSSVSRPERGKGLKNLVEFAKVHDEGRLSIYSRRGLFRIAHTRDNLVDTICRNHEKPIGGTLIEWAVKL